MLQGADPGWAAKRDTLAPKLARLPRLLARLFGQDGEASGEEDADEAVAPVRRRVARRR